MAQTAERFICQACGAAHRKWVGRCESCGEWNSVVEELAREIVPKGLGPGQGRKVELISLSAETADPPRLVSSIGEFDRSVGGGLVPGSATLIGGDPGIGKSTLLLQVSAALTRGARHCVYISGEEAPAQVRMRARRLGIADAELKLGAATSVRDVLATLDTDPAPQVVVIDSIQTMFVDQLDSAPGTVAQVRASAQELIRFAKRRDAALLLVGHVTKEGQIAGPRVLEHMVDTVLYFEGERSHQFRILRAVKNRFGGTDEIGVFEMTGAGLAEVTNPSALFLSDREAGINGAAVFAGMEGTRPVLVEIQALVAPSPLATPRRAVVGWDSGRLAMILAVLDARGGLGLAGNDVYLNVAGGLRIGEPAADLAVAAALISSAIETPMPAETVVFGEISLSGEIRPVAQSDARLKEASKLGFTRALTPPASKSQTAGIKARPVRHLRELLEFFEAEGGSTRRRRDHA
jgi:DNA repair protein RadA/Sms